MSGGGGGTPETHFEFFAPASGRFQDGGEREAPGAPEENRPGRVLRGAGRGQAAAGGGGPGPGGRPRVDPGGGAQRGEGQGQAELRALGPG